MPNPNENIVNGKYKFHSHDHDLHLISSSLNDQEEEEAEEDRYDDDDDDGLKHGELVCDGCTMPISPNKHKSDYYYMSCGECKYFLHWACFHLPPELSSHPLHPEPHHNLTLQTCPKLEFVYCNICCFHTNGLFYRCTKCTFKADIKCISLPNTIKHEAHPRHLLKLLDGEATRNDNYRNRLCGACGRSTYGCACYRCDICEITVHASCVVLPAVVSNREWDNHPLPLTFDASLNHPSGFYCDICEQEMNPKRWMYHCRTCDFSLHPRCFPTASGEYRNIKFGQLYDVASLHPGHPLRYQLLTAKLKCDVCCKRKDYGTRGFQCTSHNCEFFMCLIPCGRDRQPLTQAVD